MRRHGRCTDYQERSRIVELATSGQNDRQIAEVLGCSVWTVRKWRRVHTRDGSAGLVSHMGRPASGALATCPCEVRELLMQLRQAHPGWGADSLLDGLKQECPHFAPVLPSRARVAAYLKQKGLTRHYERHGGVVQPPPIQVTEVHEEWELDAQGAQKVADLGQVSLINISDVLSRLKVASYPWLGTHLDWSTYQLALRLAFIEYGLPKRVSFDHDSAFYDNTSQSPYPSRLQLWLVALGIEVVFITQAPPQAHAVIERTHQTLSRQALTGQTWSSQRALWSELNQRRTALNSRLPCRSLGGRPPLVAYPQAAQPQRPYRLEWESEMLDLQRVYALLSSGRWFRSTSCHGEFWLGMQRYNPGRTCAKATMVITFDAATIEFVARKEGSDITKRFATLGLTKQDLMGDPLASAPPMYQLALPFTRKAWTELATATLKTGTTL
jgi:transposase-like protein